MCCHAFATHLEAVATARLAHALLFGAPVSLDVGHGPHLHASVEEDDTATKLVSTAERTIGTRSQPAKASGVAVLSHRFRIRILAKIGTRLALACAHQVGADAVDLAHAHAARFDSCVRTSHLRAPRPSLGPRRTAHNDAPRVTGLPAMLVLSMAAYGSGEVRRISSLPIPVAHCVAAGDGDRLSDVEPRLVTLVAKRRFGSVSRIP
jgi:hypothetical protein